VELRRHGLGIFVSATIIGHATIFQGSCHLTASLPSHFNTPMFWSEEELAELKGTEVVGPFFHHEIIIIFLSPSCLVVTEPLNLD
jgi:hypothetical protein